MVLTGCLLSNVGQVPTSEQSGITYLTKNPSPPGLVGLWHFDGSANDSSGNGHNGTVHGDPTYVPGVFGSALSVNGNDYIAVGNIGVTADWTVEFWAQLASTTQTIYYPVGLSPKVGTVWGSGTYMAFQWQENKWGVYDGTNTVPGSAVLTGTWYYMAVTKFGTTYTLYRDGAYENSGSLTDIDITDLNIGRRSDGYWYFNGLINEVRIYDYALSLETIKGHAAGIYGFKGLLPPYAPPEQKAFKLGRAIPLKWQYTDTAGNVVDSDGANPKVEWTYMGESDGTGTLDEEVDAPGASGLQYDALTMTWQFNWQTKGRKVGTYEITITSDQAESSDILEIALRK